VSCRAARWARPLRGLTSGGLLLAAACATHGDAIERGQRYYEDNQYERALALWRDLDRRDADLLPGERARFSYFRGMTDYRLGFHDEARHWLAVARALELSSPGALQSVWLERLNGALLELDRGTARSRASADVVQTIDAPAEAFPSAPAAGAAGGASDAEPDPAESGPPPRGEPKLEPPEPDRH
jgi:hypothetical protein